MKTIEQEYRIKAPMAKVWQALVDPVVIAAWGGGPAVMDAREGTKFTLWGGDIYGQNTKVVDGKQLVQDWYDGSFKEASKVTFNLEEKDGVTLLRLTHADVPDDRTSDISAGWKDYYLGPLKQLLES